MRPLLGHAADGPPFGFPLSLSSSPSPQKGHPCKRSSSSRPLCGSRSHPAHSTAHLVRSLRRLIAQLCPTEDASMRFLQSAKLNCYECARRHLFSRLRSPSSSIYLVSGL